MIGVLTITLELDAEDADDDDSTEAGSLTSLEARTRLIAMAADNLAMALVSLKLREALRSRSVRDPLTKLFNRRYLEETLLRELSNCKRGNGELSVIMIDVDHFKTFNDTQGHDAGDFVLTELAMLMNTKLRKGDISCRYGGEEFVVVLPGASKEITMQRAEQLRVTFESHKFMHQARELKSVTASFGVATSPMNGVTVEAILKAADEAMYQAKEGGRNRVVAA
jgi:diguanylate cyclase (GGDEF)-like protein